VDRGLNFCKNLGQNFRQGQFESYVYELKEGTHLVCYSRGFIPASAVPVLSGSLAAGDPLGAAKLIYTYTKVFFKFFQLKINKIRFHSRMWLQHFLNCSIIIRLKWQNLSFKWALEDIKSEKVLLSFDLFLFGLFI